MRLYAYVRWEQSLDQLPVRSVHWRVKLASNSPVNAEQQTPYQQDYQQPDRAGCQNL